MAKKCDEVLHRMLDDNENMNFLIQFKTPGLGKCTWPLALRFGRKKVANRMYSPLMWAVVRRDLRLVQRLVESLMASDEDGINLPTRDGLTALMIASLHPGSFICADLLAQHAQLNLKDNEGNTALMHAVSWGNRITANILIFHGCHLDLENHEGDTALALALFGRDLSIVSDLYVNGANMNRISTVYDRTPLELAVKFGMKTSVRLLVTGCGADCNVRGTKSSPITLAASNDHLECFQILLEGGADVNTQVEGNGASLYMGAFLGNPDVVRLALSFGARVNVGAHTDYDFPDPYAVHMESEEELRKYQVLGIPSRNPEVDDLERRRYERFWNNRRKRTDTASMLLAASGEDVEANINYFSRPEAPEALRQLKNDTSLMSLCRQVVQKEIVTHRPTTNLFESVPKLPLPSLVQKYVLYDQSLEVEGEEELHYYVDTPTLSISSDDADAPNQGQPSTRPERDDGFDTDATTLHLSSDESDSDIVPAPDQ